MKKLYTFIFILSCFPALAQTITWSPQTTIAGSSFSNLHPRIALDGAGTPLVLWGNSNSEKAYFSRWNGSGFTTPVALNPTTAPVFAADWAGPDITSYGDNVYVVYKEKPEIDTDRHIYLVRSTN